MATLIATGTQVVSAKHGNGTITKIITKSTGYVEVDFNGNIRKEMAFNLNLTDGSPLKSKPVAAPAVKREYTTAEKIQSWKEMLLSVNDKWNHNSTWKLVEQTFGTMKVEAGNEFINSLMDSLFGLNKRPCALSEKQAYFLAKWAVETGKVS